MIKKIAGETWKQLQFSGNKHLRKKVCSLFYRQGRQLAIPQDVFRKTGGFYAGSLHFPGYGLLNHAPRKMAKMAQSTCTGRSPNFLQKALPA
jgi:hypothetical protein